jgi:hypothetical protein
MYMKVLLALPHSVFIQFRITKDHFDQLRTVAQSWYDIGELERPSLSSLARYCLYSFEPSSIKTEIPSSNLKSLVQFYIPQEDFDRFQVMATKWFEDRLSVVQSPVFPDLCFIIMSMAGLL